MYNTININPAYAGSRGNEYFALHRTQWVGLDGAPVTNTASINTPLNNSNLGLGISIINDKIGPTDENTISADLSYTIPASETFKLSFGWSCLSMECCRKCYGWFQVTDGLYLGYGYDLDTTNLANYNAGSHGSFLL
jgi:hypothetical protein